MYSLKKITPTNGFDFNDLNNARQNNYAWAMAELDEYIYVGTGRNVPLSVLQSLAPGINPPALLEPIPQSNLAEIWRYKKDGSLPWNRVYKAKDSTMAGFRFMISYKPAGGSFAIFAASLGTAVKVLKSTNGCDWFEMNLGTLEGTSSRSMVVFNHKLYIATVFDQDLTGGDPLLYSSRDPEFYPWEKIIDKNVPGFDPSKNPSGSIYNLAVFNNRLYVATSSSGGAQVWRTNGIEPSLNDWTLIVDKGFGDSANEIVLSVGVFKEYLYVSGTKSLPLAWAVPFGCDIIRIDKRDNWELVVGGRPLIPSTPSKGQRGNSISGLRSGFNNPFNVYAWQIQEYKGKLLVSTFDDSSNMEVILDTLLGNRAAIEARITPELTQILINIYAAVVRILAIIKYPIGFDLYESENGKTFKQIVRGGLNNPNNYGGRILFVDSDEKLYIGTANPFEGCEVWVDRNKEYCNNNYKEKKIETDSMYEIYRDLKEKLEFNEETEEEFMIISENVAVLHEFLSREENREMLNNLKF